MYLPDLPRLQQPKLLRLNACFDPRLDQRLNGRVDRLVGELERAVVMAKREFGAAHLKCAHSFFGVHVHLAHEPAWLVRADGQDRETERAVAIARGAEMLPVAIARIRDVIDAPRGRLEHE